MPTLSLQFFKKNYLRLYFYKIFSVLLLGIMGCQIPPQAQKTSLPLQRIHLVSPVKKFVLSQSFRPGHDGIDLVGRRGEPIYASHIGRVVYVGQGFSGYGLVIILENGYWATLYGHLSHAFVKVGERVRSAQVIGAMGDSGRATGVHLHFELFYLKRRVNPQLYFKN